MVDLVERGEALLPGSRSILDADLWNLLQDDPRTLYDTHLAVEKLLRQFGLVRIHQAQVKSVGTERLKKLPGSLAPTDYASQLCQLMGNYPTFDIDVLSLLANLIHEAYLMGNRELHEMHLGAFASHYSTWTVLKVDPRIHQDLSFEIQRKIINQHWWHAGYQRPFGPIDAAQLLLATEDWDTLKEERPDLAGMKGWLRIRIDP